jgi:hypothetical protein
MTSFLITFKPSHESPRGWPLKSLQKVVRRHQAGERFTIRWRFHNRKDVSIGDRVFVLQQGKSGPAIIGYGLVAGLQVTLDNVAIKFDKIVDPEVEVLATRQEVLAIPDIGRLWRTETSGIRLPAPVARARGSARRNRKTHTNSQLKPRLVADEQSFHLAFI